MEKLPAVPWRLRREEWLKICPQSQDAENVCGVTAAWWTWLLLLIPHFFATNTLFLGLQNRGNERQWAMGTGIAAAAWLVSRAVPHPAMRFLSSAANAGAFAFIAASIAESSPLLWKEIPATTGFGVYAALSVTSWVGMIRIGAKIVASGLRAYNQKRGGKAFTAARQNGENSAT